MCMSMGTQPTRPIFLWSLFAASSCNVFHSFNWERERQRENRQRQRQRETKTERQRDRKTERDRDRDKEAHKKIPKSNLISSPVYYLGTISHKPFEVPQLQPYPPSKTRNSTIKTSHDYHTTITWHTLVIREALSRPVWRTWGPRQRSMRVPQRYTVVVGVVIFSFRIRSLNLLYWRKGEEERRGGGQKEKVNKMKHKKFHEYNV